jgi:hypothetical protein
LVPTGTKVTKYEVGAPTSISLINPTSLIPSGVVVDSYGNLDSLVLKNVPNNKAYALFDKIMSTYVYGGNIIFGKHINDGTRKIVDSVYDETNISDYISVEQGISISSTYLGNNGGSRGLIVEYDENKNVVDYWDPNCKNLTLNSRTRYLVLGTTGDSATSFATYMKIVDNTNNQILFEYRKS